VFPKLFSGLFSLYFTLALFTHTSFASTVKQTSSKKFNLQTVFKNDEVVWSFAFISPEELLITLRKGQLLYYNLKTKEQKKLTGPTVTALGQGGLLDVHYRQIKGKNFIYLTFSEKVKGVVTTSLARGRYQNKAIKNLQTLFQAQVSSTTSKHFGSRLVFHQEYIFMTIGDRGERKYAQSLSHHNGKILRLTLLGQAAANNPFATNKDALPEIWSLGHRNPQGIALDPLKQNIYSCEFGPRGGDELNHIIKGKNYGWPLVTYGREYWGPTIGVTARPDMQAPVAYWVPSISPSGMVFYRGTQIKEWENNLFLANLSSRHLRRLVLKDNVVIQQEELFKDLNERIRHVRNSPDGYLYFSTDSGKIIKIGASPTRDETS